jgi:hypothetical protein
MSIRLHVGQLVLDGLPLSHRDGPIVQEAFKAELARLLAEGGLEPELATGIAVPGLAAEEVQVSPGDGPGAIGQRIARAVYGGLGNERA